MACQAWSSEKMNTMFGRLRLAACPGAAAANWAMLISSRNTALSEINRNLLFIIVGVARADVSLALGRDLRRAQNEVCFSVCYGVGLASAGMAWRYRKVASVRERT